MSLGAKKLNAGSNAGQGSAKGVLSKAVLSKTSAPKPVSKVAAASPKAELSKPTAKAIVVKPDANSAQKLAVPTRAALVNKPNGTQKTNGKPVAKSTQLMNKPMSAIPIPRSAPAPIDPRLEPFRALLEAKREELRRSLGDTRYGAQGQNGRVAEEDQAAVSHEEFISSKRNSMEFRMLRLVNAALGRIERGEYGICHACEEDISEKRLKAIPWAEFCVQCQDSHGNVDHDVSEAATPAGAAPALQVWNW